MLPRSILPPCFLRGFAAALAFTCIGFSARAQSPLNTLYSFSYSDGAQPRAALTLGSDGNFYGTAYEGGAGNDGTIFQLTPSGTLTTLYSFNVIVGGVSNFDGYYPAAGLVQGNDGNFYGTTEYGGRADAGTVFQLTPAGVLTILHAFDNSDGTNPTAALIQGNDGNFYGTTKTGGANDEGTIFSITPAGVLTTLHDFNGNDGARPTAALVQGSDGNFYGVAESGGSGSGTVFAMTPAGMLTTLYVFGSSDGDGSAPVSALIQGGDGDFYGTTSFGGVDGGNGVIFKLTPGGAFTLLHTFDGEDGTDAQSLLEGSDGNFYGTTSGGGSVANNGTIFRLTPSGVLNILYRFTGGTDGSTPLAGLVRGNDGNFYGTTSQRGDNFGTVFQFNPTLADAEAVQTVSLAVAGSGEAQFGKGNGKVIFRRVGDTSEPLPVYYKVRGSAKPGVDIQPVSGMVVIPAGATQTKLKIKPQDDPANTGTLKAKVVLLPASDGSYQLGSPAKAKISVVGGG